jgi:T5orf172 domain
MIAIFYVLSEHGNYSQEDRFKFTKIGCCKGDLSQRLRMLNQGNPRPLKMDALYVGPSYQVESLERWFKQEHLSLASDEGRGRGHGRTEWYNKWADEVIDIVDRRLEFVRQRGFQKDIYKIINNRIIPYRWGSLGTCPIERCGGITYYYNEAKEHHHRLQRIDEEKQLRSEEIEELFALANEL